MRGPGLVSGLGRVLVLLFVVTGCTSPSAPLSDAPHATSDVVPAVLPPDGAALFRIACAGCHRVEPGGPHDVGPNLHGIVGQPAASRPDYAYSDALQASELIWDRSTLAAWIAATETLVPGTTMTYANILSGDEVARVLDHLLQVTATDIAHHPKGKQDEN